MNFDIFMLLGQDGLVSGAIYALVALALVLVYAVTRAIFLPQCELIAFGALTMASLELGRTPQTIWLLVGLGTLVCIIEVRRALRTCSISKAINAIGWHLALPIAIASIVLFLSPQQSSYLLQVFLTLLIMVPLGPLIYKLAYQPIADASVLVLLILSVAVEFVLLGFGLIFFGPEGYRTEPPFSEVFVVAGVVISAQNILILCVSALIIAGLYFFFGKSLLGKALRATAINRRGARIVGIRTAQAGSAAFLLAAFLGAVAGILLVPITTVYYDSGFLIGLKAFVGAIIGGLVSYPIAAAGAVLVGVLEAFSSFWASSFKEVIVFALIIPVLLWRSMTTTMIEDEEDSE